MELDALAAFFGWMTVVNLGVYLAAVLSIFTARKQIMGLHTGIFDIPEARVRELWYAWLGTYKIAILSLNLVPYIALRLVL
ncbi:MAG: DUF6868 family protein [Pseudomonadota bacterium]